MALAEVGLQQNAAWYHAQLNYILLLFTLYNRLSTIRYLGESPRLREAHILHVEYVLEKCYT